MCGIIGYVGKETKAISYVINGLKNLEYRGYDSSGIAYLTDDKLQIVKQSGKIKNLEEVIDYSVDSSMAIGHTRWATHGIPSSINAHPHQVGKITIVHNGIIENYEEIKQFLKQKNTEFKSETDTEVACALLNYLYDETKDMFKAISRFKEIVRGSYALGIIVEDEFNKIYAIRNGSPLIVALSEKGNFIASDVPAILDITNKYYILEPDEIAVLTSDEIVFYDKLKKVNKDILTFEDSYSEAIKDGYEHFMLKEIEEQPSVIERLIKIYLKDNIIEFDDIDLDFNKYDNINIVACGSAYHTGLVAKRLFEEVSDIRVSVDLASEFRYQKNYFNDRTLVIVVSQSGETADTLASLRLAKEHNVKTLAIVNVFGSSIAREADYVIYIKAGIEIAVATTKAYTAQLMVFILLSLKIGKKVLEESKYNDIIADIYLLPSLMTELLNRKEEYREIAETIYKHDDVFFIGRLIDYAICEEGSLKLKEISYINTQCYAAGELKHGTISLINQNTPVISIISEERVWEKTISNIKEVNARGAKSIIITNRDISDESISSMIIKIPKLNYLTQAILFAIPLQLIAYEVACLRGCDVDQPKNLAKSVTVE